MIITLDFETFYNNDYSLTKMSETDYILDPRFEVIMCAIKVGNGPIVVHTDDKSIRAAFAAIDWSACAVLAHNMRFDGAILAWRYGVRPKLWLDTLSMANALVRAVTGRVSLASMARHFNLVAKGTTVGDMKGRTRASLSPSELKTYADYCEHDTELCRIIFDNFMKAFPKRELALIDLLLRMFIEPQALLNPIKLAEYLHLVRAEKAASFARVAHISEDQFSSNIKFAALLRSYGIEPPKKFSPITGGEIFALAKNDRAFKDMCGDQTLPMDVQVLLAVRLGARSTIEETRSATLLNMATGAGAPCWGPHGGYMPVPYKYFGAHTGRVAGDGGYNFTNLKRGSPLRDAIEAPAGYRVVHRDASQIEARVVAWLAGCAALVEAFRQGRDVYSEFAGLLYHRAVTKADTLERFTGKTAILSLGYGAGAERFRQALYIGSGGMSVALTLEGAEEVIRVYRSTYAPIQALWRLGNQALRRMISPTTVVSPLIPVIEIGDKSIFLPNDLAIQYPELREELVPETGERCIVYRGTYGGARKIYGAKLVENITQALAHIVVADIMLRVKAMTGLHPFMSTYDSHDYIVPESDVVAFDALLEREFAVTPAWAPDLPLASEGGWGRTLLEAERGVNQ